MINLVVGGLTPRVPVTRLQELGYAVAIHPGQLARRATAAMLAALCELNGTDPSTHRAGTPTEFFNLVGLAEWSDIEARYAPTEACAWA
ncbi:putative carboxy-phosphonoenolpyruvate mutase domain protein [Mycobacterium kansasii 824]|nr:putative carboxy-phosphonoenolpyruvate mutase domain protein [Mycobacterium kansasii 824]